jgi:hypothetical protein
VGLPPRFPVEARGVDGLHAALFKESRTRGPRSQREVGNLGSPIVFVPRIPDFLSRLVTLSNIMRLSLREIRTRGRGQCCVVGNPGNAGANVGHPDGSVTPQKA